MANILDTHASSLRGAAAVAVLILLAVAALWGRRNGLLQTAETSPTGLRLAATDRLLILAPHPDDETLACGGIIQKAVRMGLPVRVVFLTNGDNNEWSFVLYHKRPELLPGQVEAMGLVRHDEAVAATHILGLAPDQLTFLGYPDFGTLQIWMAHWGAEPPLRSMLTRVTAVPYPNAYRPGAGYKGEEILADLEAILKEFRPTKIFLSHPADHNPDHLALYTFTRVALWDLGLAPELYPYLVHTPRWPEPRGLAPTQPLAPPATLAAQGRWWTSPLSREETARKLAALEAHRTQYKAAARFLASFVRANELFNIYPEVTLPAGGADAALAADAETLDAQVTEQFTTEEQAAFVGVEWHTVRREGNDLVLVATLSKPLAKGVALSVYLFGYRPDKPFAGMPKIHVRVGELSDAVYDQTREREDSGVQVRRDARAIVLRVPLALLGGPDRAFLYARTYLGDLPLDSAAWQVIYLPAQ
jgi:LmbE family N-acetylglucosaminyl deacetylase